MSSSINSSINNTVLAQFHSHLRDGNIEFFEKGHQYKVIDDTCYTSVTTFVHSHFPKFNPDMIIKSMMNGKNWGPEHKYWGKSAEEIKASWSSNGAATAGTNLHYQIECFMNNQDLRLPYNHKELFDSYASNVSSMDKIEKEIEWSYFIQFIKDFPHLKPYRTEWIVYDEDVKIAGSIDMVYENEDGTISIYDWKRSKEISSTKNYKKFAYTQCIKHIPHTNFWHYALQLNIYKTILENKYGKKVKELYLVRLHPNNTNESYELIKLPFLEEEMSNLFQEKKEKLSL
jgi:ATP-dependent exoDNAse (exonuclease V) beta subunit